MGRAENMVQEILKNGVCSVGKSQNRREVREGLCPSALLFFFFFLATKMLLGKYIPKPRAFPSCVPSGEGSNL